MTFIYTLSDPDTNTVRYVGKSDLPARRLASHFADQNPCHRTHWLAQLKAAGKTPLLEVIDEVPVSEWEFWEREYIKVFRAIGLPLVNQTPGGDSGPFGKGKANPNFGKRGTANHLFGKKLSAETRQRMSLAQKGKVVSAPTREKIRAVRLSAINHNGSRPGSASGLKGVSWSNRRKKWRAEISARGRRLALGYFEAKEAAARAYDAAVRKYRPLGSYLNFPNEV